MEIAFSQFEIDSNLGEQGSTAGHLRQVIVPIWSTDECAESDYGKKRLTSNMMCAGYQEGGKDACQGYFCFKFFFLIILCL